MPGHLISHCNARVMLNFHKSMVAKLAAGAPQETDGLGPQGASRRRAACWGDPDQRERRRSRGEVSSYVRRTRDYGRRARISPCGHFHSANRRGNCFAYANIKSRCGFGAVEVGGRGRVVGSRQGRSDVLLRRTPPDNGPDGSRPEGPVGASRRRVRQTASPRRCAPPVSAWITGSSTL